MHACAPQGAPNQLVTNINKEVIFHKMVFEGLNLGPGAPNSGCGSTGKKVTVNRLRFAIAFPSREYDPENILFACETAICNPRNNKRLRPDASNLACRSTAKKAK